MARLTTRGGWCAAPMLALMLMASSPAAQAQSGHPLLGGPHGVVKSSKGDLLEGMMVQLIAQKTAIRTTVYSNVDGRYEFPKLEPGSYTLRSAQPREFQPWVKKDVTINGSPALDDIKLTRAFKVEFLPYRSDIAAQMTGTEWLMSLSGSI